MAKVLIDKVRGWGVGVMPDDASVISAESLARVVVLSVEEADNLSLPEIPNSRHVCISDGRVIVVTDTPCAGEYVGEFADWLAVVVGDLLTVRVDRVVENVVYALDTIDGDRLTPGDVCDIDEDVVDPVFFVYVRLSERDMANVNRAMEYVYSNEDVHGDVLYPYNAKSEVYVIDADDMKVPYSDLQAYVIEITVHRVTAHIKVSVDVGDRMASCIVSMPLARAQVDD